MHWQRKSGILLMAAGSLLLAVWLAPTVYGRASAGLAVAAFRAQGGSNRLWDAARIRAYQRTLDVAIGEPEAILRVPKAGIEVPVYEGTGDLALNRGVGHIPGTAMPGANRNLAGNIAITGHRDGFFRGLKDVIPGDRIELERGGSVQRYVVETTRVVFPGDTSVLNPTDSNTKDSARLTLITCYPFYYVGAAPQRFVVQARLLDQ